MLRAVVLVEGSSDRVALHTLAGRRGRDLGAEGIQVVAMDGILVEALQPGQEPEPWQPCSLG